MAFVIMQKCEGHFVYYYQDACYFPYFDTVDEFEEVMRNVDRDLIEELKVRNDWNREIDASKCTEAKITDEKSDGKVNVQDFEFDEIVYTYASTHGYQGNDQSIYKYSEYCNSDLEGKELYYVSGMSSDDYGDGPAYDTYKYAVIVNADGTFSDNPIIEISRQTLAERVYSKPEKYDKIHINIKRLLE